MQKYLIIRKDKVKLRKEGGRKIFGANYKQ